MRGNRRHGIIRLQLQIQGIGAITGLEGGVDKMQEYRRYDTFAIQQFSMGKTSRFKLFRFMLGLLVRRRLQEGPSAAARPGYGRFSKLNKIIA